MEQLRTAVENLKSERIRAIGDLRRAVLDLGPDCPPDRRLEVVRVIYWRHTEISLTDLRVAFGFPDQAGLMAAVGRVASGAVCDDCADPLLASSRQELAELERLASRGRARYGYGYDRARLCTHCQEREDMATYDEPPEGFYDDECAAWDQAFTS